MSADHGHVHTQPENLNVPLIAAVSLCSTVFTVLMVVLVSAYYLAAQSGEDALKGDPEYVTPRQAGSVEGAEGPGGESSNAAPKGFTRGGYRWSTIERGRVVLSPSHAAADVLDDQDFGPLVPPPSAPDDGDAQPSPD